MELIINGTKVTPKPEQSLYEMVKELGLFKGKLSTDPIAAKIAGRVFTLNYIPLRQKDIEERSSIRRAMAFSDGTVTLLRYCDPAGYEVYTKTAQFALFLAIRRLWPKARAQMNCTIGSGLYIKVMGDKTFSAERLKEEVEKIVAENIMPQRKRISTKEAIEHYTAQGQLDKASLFSYRKKPTIDVYCAGEYSDYFYGEMAPSTAFLRSWDILPAPEGFIFVFPDRQNPDQVARYKESPNFFNVSNEGKRWCELMECDTVSDLNKLVTNGGRVLGATAIADTLENAINGAYAMVQKIHFENAYYRNDIGQRALRAKEK